jgi:hypothetical protein
MELGEQFSLEDFLAYFFPGVLATVGVFVTLLFTHISFPEPLKDFALVIFLILLSVSYSVGVLLSGFSEKWFRNTNIKGNIPERIKMFENEIKEAFKKTFELKNPELDWGPEYYYLCRSIVLENMPNIAPFIHRQIALRQLRMNLFIPLMIWIIDGILFGIKAAREWTAWDKAWGIGLIGGLILLGWAIKNNLKDRMDNNEYREVREVLTSFLAGYRSDAFKSKNTHSRKE